MHMADALSGAYLPYQQAMRGCKKIVFALDTRSIVEMETEGIKAVKTVNVSSWSVKEIVKETEWDPVYVR